MGQDIIIKNINLAAQEWVVLRNELLSRSGAIRAVIDDHDFQEATGLVSRLSKQRRELEEQRKSVTSRIDAIKKDIMAQEKELAGGIEQEYARLRELCSAYATRLAEEREAAERARREAEAEQAMAQEAAQAAFGADAVAVASPFIPPAPDRLRAGGGVRQVTQYVFEVTDPTLLDRKFLSPDEKKIRAFVQYVKTQGIAPEAVNEPGLKITKKVGIN